MNERGSKVKTTLTGIALSPFILAGLLVISLVAGIGMFLELFDSKNLKGRLFNWTAVAVVLWIVAMVFLWSPIVPWMVGAIIAASIGLILWVVALAALRQEIRSEI